MNIDDFDFEATEPNKNSPCIKVIGVGGGGCNAVAYMETQQLTGIDFYVANTDSQALHHSSITNKIQLGQQITKGLGAGADPEIGRKAAEEDSERIRNMLTGADMIFITCGMGGGTGTGASSVIAELAKSMNILTVAIVTTPFIHEGKKRQAIANQGLHALSEHVDSLIVIPNDKLLSVLGEDVSLLEAFKTANHILLNAVKGIADLIHHPGLINVDFADVKTVMQDMGEAMMGAATASGEMRAKYATEQALSSPLLQDVNPTGAKGILVNVTAGNDLTLGEFREVGDIVKKFVLEDATVVIGTVIDESYKGEIKVTVIITGIADKQAKVKPKALKHEKPMGNINYDDMDVPAFLRKK